MSYGLLSQIAGAVAVLASWLPAYSAKLGWLPLVLAGVALVFGIMQEKRNEGSGLSGGGIVTSVVALMVSALLLLAAVTHA